MLPVNFNHLYYFWCAARDGRISTAARRLYLTQSTLSLQIKQLERSLGAALLVRGRRGVALTQAGRAAFDHAERVFGAAERLGDDVRQGVSPPAPALRLSVSIALASAVSARLLEYLGRAAPGTPLLLSTDTMEVLREKVVRRQADLAVTEQDPAVGLGADVRSRLVARLPLWFAAAPTRRGREFRFPRDLEGMPLLLREPADPVRKHTDHFLYERGLRAEVRGEVGTGDALESLAAQGLGVAVLDQLTLETGERAKRLVRLHKRPLSFTQDVWFLYRRHHKEEPLLQGALDLLMDDFRLGA